MKKYLPLLSLLFLIAPLAHADNSYTTDTTSSYLRFDNSGFILLTCGGAPTSDCTSYYNLLYNNAQTGDQIIITGSPADDNTYTLLSLNIWSNNSSTLQLYVTPTPSYDYSDAPNYAVTISDSSFVCIPSTISNGTVGSYPSCTVTCNSGYTLTGSVCVAGST